LPVFQELEEDDAEPQDEQEVAGAVEMQGNSFGEPLANDVTEQTADSASTLRLVMICVEGGFEIREYHPDMENSDETEQSEEEMDPEMDTSQRRDDQHVPNTGEQSVAPHNNSHQDTSTHYSMVSVKNPEDFPLERIQIVQSRHYPSTRITDIWAHHETASDNVIQVIADIDQGPIDHLIIRDPRLISALGLREGLHDTLTLRPSELYMDETFKIKIFPGQAFKDPTAWVAGELVSARNAYLHWLDNRNSVDPKVPPSAQEIRTLAVQLGRRAPHVWQEVKKMWDLEQGNGGRHYRENRIRYLGENPVYPEGEEKRSAQGMW